MSRVAKLAPALAALTFALTASAGLKSVGNGTVKFFATGTAGLKIDGKGDKLTVAENGGTIQLTASTCGLDTGIGLRDKHLRKYLKADCEAKKNTTAVLTVDKGKLKFPDDNGTVSAKAKGKFKLAGSEQDQDFSYTASREGKGVYKVTGKMDVDITRYGIEEPKYLGVGVNKDVKVEVSFKVKDE